MTKYLLFLILEALRKLQDNQSTQGTQIMAKFSDVQTAVLAAVTDTKAALSASVEKEKTEVLARIDALAASFNIPDADVTALTDAVKSIGSDASASVDTISDVQDAPPAPPAPAPTV